MLHRNKKTKAAAVTTAAVAWTALFAGMAGAGPQKLVTGVEVVFQVSSVRVQQKYIKTLLTYFQVNLELAKVPHGKFSTVVRNGRAVVRVKFLRPKDGLCVRRMLPALVDNLVFHRQKNVGGSATMEFVLSSETIKGIQAEVIEKTMAIIRLRLQGLKLPKLVVRRQGPQQILVRVAGHSNVGQVVKQVVDALPLNFHLVNEAATRICTQREAACREKKTQCQDLRKRCDAAMRTGGKTNGTLDTARFVFSPSSRHSSSFIFLYKKPVLSSRIFERIKVEFGDNNRPHISLRLDASGAKKFKQITRKYVKKRLAVVFNGLVYSAPTIQEEIPSGRAQITGNFTIDEAKALAGALRAGKLPVDLKVVRQRVVRKKPDRRTTN
jgi:protein-export membrane protein SecD